MPITQPTMGDRIARAADGEMAAAIRGHDWSGSLGAPAGWPQPLRTLSDMMLAAGQPMFVAWGPQRILLYNDAYAPIMGRKHPGALGRPFFAVWPEVEAVLTPLFDRVFAGEPVHMQDIAVELVRTDRPEEAHFAFSYTPVRGEDGRVEGLFCACTETTGQVLAERALRRSEARASSVLENMGDGFVLLDHDFRVVAINAAAMRLERRPREAMIGLKAWQLWPGVQDVELGRVCRRAMADREPAEVQHHQTWPDGRAAWIEARVYPMDDGLAIVYRDITARRRAAQALAEREQQLRLVVDNATDYAILTIDRERRVTSWSAGAAATFGYSAEEIVGQLDDIMFTPEDRAVGRSQFEAELAVRQGSAPNKRWHLRRDGSRVFLDGSVRVLRDDGGRHIGFLKIARDETVRNAADARLRESEARLAESEAKLRAITNSIDQMVWSALPDGSLDFYNQRWYDYTGIAPGSTDSDAWRGMFHPDDRERAWAGWDHSLATGAPYEVEYRLCDRFGHYRWVLGRALPVHDAEGRIVRWFGTCTDIQEMVEAREILARSREQLEREVAERTRERDRTWQNTQDLLLVVDPAGHFRAVNPAWTTVLGWRAEELIGRYHLDIIHPDDHDASHAALARASQEGLPRFENRVRHVNGSHRWFEWSSAVEGDLVYASGRDITEQKAAAAALGAAQEQLRQSQKMEAVGQLTGGVAHDFNNLLQIVVGNLEMMQRHLPAENARLQRGVENAMVGARRAATLTQRLLAFSRRQPLAPEPVDANVLVDGMSELLRRALGETIALKTVLAPGVWFAEADPNQLESAILNLAVNARDAMPAGGELVIETANAELDDAYVQVHADASAGQYVVIAVSDTGHGMDAATLARVFEPFFTTKEVGRGTGLGLAMVYGFVRQSNGHVAVQSQPGAGTTIRIYLPRLPGPARSDPPAPVGTAADVAPSETILVVEDDEGVRALSVEVLRELGYQVLEASDGPSALRVLASPAAQALDLLFTDVVLPGGMTGADLVGHAVASRPGLKVLFTTGYARNAITHDGRLDEGVSLLPKPFTLSDLAARVRAVLEKA